MSNSGNAQKTRIQVRLKLWNAYQRLNRRQKQILLIIGCQVGLTILTQALFHSVRALEQAAGPFMATFCLLVVCLIVTGRKTTRTSDTRPSDRHPDKKSLGD
jgi:hypothetical protein